MTLSICFAVHLTLETLPINCDSHLAVTHPPQSSIAGMMAAWFSNIPHTEAHTYISWLQVERDGVQKVVDGVRYRGVRFSSRQQGWHGDGKNTWPQRLGHSWERCLRRNDRVRQEKQVSVCSRGNQSNSFCAVINNSWSPVIHNQNPRAWSDFSCRFSFHFFSISPSVFFSNFTS